MQVSLNNLAPPNPGFGMIGGPDNKGRPDMSIDFKAMVQKKPSRSTLETNPGDKSQRKAPSMSPNSGNAHQVSEETKRTEGDSEKPSSIKSKSSKDSKTKSASVRGNAVLKFMDSLESELGITADRFSAVLAQLPPEVKAMPVEQSASFVMEQLGIPTGQQAAATDAYVNLLRKNGLVDQPLSQSPLQGHVAPMADFSANNELVAKGAQLETELGVGRSERQRLNATIDELNRKFFDVQAKSKSAEGVSLENFKSSGALDASLLQSSLVDESSMTMRSDGNGIPLGALSQIEVPFDRYQALGDNVQPLASQGLEQTQANELPLTTLSDLEALGSFTEAPTAMSFTEAASENADLKKLASSGVKTWSVEELPFLANPQMGELSQSVKGFDSAQGAKDFQFGEDGLANFSQGEAAEINESVDNFANVFYGATEDAYGKQFQPQSAINNTSSSGVTVTPQDRLENLNKISRATEALASNGGGEMKVILTPEGMGTIQLKVKMQEGKLQVEMKTDNLESQRLLENGLSELKQSLSAHRLSVDSVKVDVGGDFTRQESSQSFSQPQFDMGRDQARQFMNLFREGNFSQRQSFFDAPGFKTYRTQKEEPLAPISTEIRPRSSLSNSKGKELNLVA